ELEFVNGYIYANVWYSNFIYKIDVSTGIVVEKYDLSSLVESTNKNENEDDMFFVTGKNWPYIYKIRLE
ncbi:glutaminyl-peptide cyclotransferase, partial [Enterococcus casseliflavus]|uniref:glutaminyl-peptide cyclotransferase n=1 Tax=Enterococcus casseliflavus TaxID=37734 RepID=UPI001027D993